MLTNNILMLFCYFVNNPLFIPYYILRIVDKTIYNNVVLLFCPKLVIYSLLYSPSLGQNNI